MRKPTFVSFIIATFNSAKTLDGCLESIDIQNYPKNNIEIIIADGGSTDDTFKIAKKYNAKIIHVNSEKQGAEYNRAIGAAAARNEILAFVDHDNILPHENWLKKMVEPFQGEEAVVGVETIRYFYDKKDSLLGRYFSLFGVNDVLPFYLGKADRLSYLYNKPQDYGTFKKCKVIERGNYYIVDFLKDQIPTLGSNGFLIRKKILFENAKTDPDHFFHIDVNVDLIKKGFSKYAFIKDSIIHKTQERGIFDYLSRRKMFMERYHFVNYSNRRYSVYEKKDFFKLIIFVFISLTVVKPFIDSTRGYIKIHDLAWFLHPFISFTLLIVYGYAVFKKTATKYAKLF